MITSITLWNELNSLSHWDFEMDQEWREFALMIRHGAAAIKKVLYGMGGPKKE